VAKPRCAGVKNADYKIIIACCIERAAKIKRREFMAIDLVNGERAFTVVFKRRRFLRIEAAAGTDGDQITDMTPEEEQTFAQSNYGLRPVVTIYETNTQGPNTCYMIIARKKVAVPCN
jgi:hypothetical protein